MNPACSRHVQQFHMKPVTRDTRRGPFSLLLSPMLNTAKPARGWESFRSVSQSAGVINLCWDKQQARITMTGAISSRGDPFSPLSPDEWAVNALLVSPRQGSYGSGSGDRCDTKSPASWDVAGISSYYLLLQKKQKQKNTNSLHFKNSWQCIRFCAMRRACLSIDY